MIHRRRGKACPVPIDGTCVLLLDSEDSLGTTYLDGSQYANHATRAGPTQSNGIDGLALTYGTADYSLDIADAASLDCTALTISAWVKLDATWAAVGYILAKCKDIDDQFSYALSCDTTGKLRLDISDDGAAGSLEATDDAISLTVWHHLVGTFTGGTYALYVDGAIVASDGGGA